MKYTIKPTSKFQKDLKKAKKRGCDIDELKIIIKTLANGEKLDKKYKDHSLIFFVQCLRQNKGNRDSNYIQITNKPT